MPKGQQRTCPITGLSFRGDSEDLIHPNIRQMLAQEIAKEIAVNEELRNKVVTAMLQAEDTAVMLSRAVFATKAKDIGLLTSGSVADLFCAQIKKARKKKTKKTS